MPFRDQDKKPFNKSHIMQILNSRVGVYGIFSYAQCLYVGQSMDIQARLLEHYNGQSDQSVCIKSQSPIYFYYDEVSMWSLDDVERRLIDELEPICNKS